MAKYTGTILTNKGKELLARAILGEAIVFTKVEIGKGILSPGTDKETLISLVDSFKILSITSTTKLQNGSFRIRVSFNNKGFVDDTYLREIGVFARGEDGVEVLYSYCNTDTPNLIPNETSGKIELIEDIITFISSAATINAVIDQSNVYATIRDLTEGLATKEDKFNKNGAFNKPFGTTSGTVMEGNKRATDLGGEAAFSKKDAFNRSFSHVISSTSKILVASAYAVKTAYDKGATALTKATTAQNSANSAQTKANEAYTLASGKEPKFTKNSAFNKAFSHVVTSTSKVLVASAYAVKLAYDKGVSALNLANTNKNAIHNNTEQIDNLNLKVEDNNFHGYKKLRGSTPPNNFLIPSGVSYWLSSSEEGWAAVTAKLGTSFVYIECHSQYSSAGSRGVMQILRPYKPLSGKYKYGIRFGSESTWGSIIYVDQDILDKDKLVYGDSNRGKSTLVNKVLDITKSGFYAYEAIDDPNKPSGGSGYITATAYSNTSIGLIYTTTSGAIQVSSNMGGVILPWVTYSEKDHKHSALDITSGKKTGFNLDKSDSLTTDSTMLLATSKAIKTIWDTLTGHRNSVVNPHVVTKTQIGLGNVDNHKNVNASNGLAENLQMNGYQYFGDFDNKEDRGKGLKSFVRNGAWNITALDGVADIFLNSRKVWRDDTTYVSNETSEGWQKFPNGVMFCWGEAMASQSDVSGIKSFNFPVTFTTVHNVTCNEQSNENQATIVSAINFSTTGANVSWHRVKGSSTGTTRYFAIGTWK